MEFFERTEVYSKIFPNATPAAMEKEADELLQTAIARGEINELPPFSEFVENLKKSFTFEPKPDAEEKAKEFISYAIKVCNDLEFDTKITRGKHDVSVSMFVYYAQYEGNCKHEIETLISLSDEISLTSNSCKPDCVCMTLTYNTHYRYYQGQK